jgi:hypothetical protein
VLLRHSHPYGFERSAYNLKLSAAESVLQLSTHITGYDTPKVRGNNKMLSSREQ